MVAPWSFSWQNWSFAPSFQLAFSKGGSHHHVQCKEIAPKQPKHLDKKRWSTQRICFPSFPHAPRFHPSLDTFLLRFFFFVELQLLKCSLVKPLSQGWSVVTQRTLRHFTERCNFFKLYVARAQSWIWRSMQLDPFWHSWITICHGYHYDRSLPNVMISKHTEYQAAFSNQYPLLSARCPKSSHFLTWAWTLAALAVGGFGMQKMSSVILIAPTGKLLRFQLLPLQKGTREAQRMKSATHCGHTILTFLTCPAWSCFICFQQLVKNLDLSPTRVLGLSLGHSEKGVIVLPK